MKTLITTILLWTSTISLVIAQKTQYQFSHLNNNNGLSNNRVTCIFKDSRGFMWFGTKSGLNRFDGYNFKIFKHNANDSTSINDDHIISIDIGPQNEMWVKTHKGFNIYNPLTDRFDHQIKTVLNNYHIPEKLITSIKQAGKNKFWFMEAGNGFYLLNVLTKQITRFKHAVNDTTSVYNGTGTDMAPDNQGNLWVAYNDGTLEKIDAKTEKVSSRIHNVHNTNPLDQVDYHLFVDGQNDVWVYATNLGDGVFFIRDKIFCKHLLKNSGDIKISSDIVFDVIQDNNGLIWIGTDHGGIDLLDKQKLVVLQSLTNEPDDKRSLNQDCIISLFKDNENIIWAGTFKRGISYYHPGIIKFPVYRYQPSKQNGLSFDDDNRFVEDREGNIWIGSNGGGLIYFNRKTGTFKTYLHNEKDPNSLSNNVIASLCLDHSNKLWIGTYFGGLDCFDGKVFKHHKHLQTDTRTIADDKIWEIFEDSKNRLWIGTLNAGLDMFDRQRNVFVHYPPGPNSVPHPYVSGLGEDKNKNLWVGTYQGLAVLLNGAKSFKYYKHSENDKQSLSNDNISNLMVDSRNLVWLATNEGLSMFDGRTGKFTNFHQADGLPDDALLTVVEDKLHNLWISTLNGISNLIITKKGKGYRYEFKNYDQSDGLQGKEFNEDAGLATRDGELIFGGSNGFNIFRPENIISTREKLVPLLIDFQLFNKSLPAGEKVNDHVILSKSINETSEITLHHNENVFSIAFAAINFLSRSKIKYEYKLEDFDRTWIASDDKVRTASYTNLDPGTYIFRLRCAGEDGKWAVEQVALKITVLPPVWQTPVAYFIYAMMVLGVLFFIRNKGIQKLKAEFSIEQERQETQRMHELDLMKIKFFTNVSHEFRTPLALILAPVDKLLKQEVGTELHKHLQMINRNGKRLLNLVNQLLDFRKMEVNELKLDNKKADIVQFIEEVVYSFSDIAEGKKITLSFKTQVEQLITSFDVDKVERILFNLLSNAFKFTHECGSVDVKLSIENASTPKKMLKIEVSDTGIGIPQEKVEKVFERFFQSDMPGSMVNQGSGIGLAITKEFVSLHQGTIKVESVINQGSRFTVLLPVKHDHHLQNTDKNIVINNGGKDLPLPSLIIQNTAKVSVKEQQTNLKKPLILLIEDNEDFRFYLKDNLKEQYQIIEAVNGLDGWQKALANHPRLIVSDISMPEMNGLDLCHKIKHDSRTLHIPVILLTAITGQSEELKGLESGPNDYLTKPFNFEILLSKIKNLLNQQNILKKAYQKQLDLNTVVTQPDANDKKFMVDIVKHIEKQINDPDFSVEKLSSDMFMSRVTLYRKTLQMTERTPVEFIKLIRLKKATQLLENTHLNIAEIAYKVGFNNPKYFAKSFKIEFNRLPTDYRAAMQKTGDEPVVNQ